MAFLTAEVIAIGVILIVAIIQYSSKKPSCPPGTKLPPGPKGVPLLGNLPQIPQKHSWLQFKKWGDEYGPLCRLNIAGWEHFVISSERIANDLLQKRGAIYSSRGGFPAAATLLSGDLRPLFSPYNETWKGGRKLAHSLAMGTRTSETYRSIQSFESLRTILDLIKNPVRYEHWLERYSSAIMFRLTYGKAVETGDEDYVRSVLEVLHTVERVASPGAYMVDTFPSLMHVPEAIAPFKKELAGLHQRELKLFRGLVSDVQSEIQNDTAPPSFTRSFLENKSEYGLSDDEGAYVMGALIEAGSGTTAATMMSFILAMVHHPEYFKSIQEEVDENVGKDRIPQFDDIPKLPKVRAALKETLRWRPVTAGGVPHMVTQDDVYEGFFIPAGTNIHANQWAIHRDPALYPDAETFNPARWLEPQYPTYREPLSEYPNIQNFSAFGFGRRICAGQAIAEMSLNLLTARLAWACDIQKKRNADGSEVEVPLYDYCSGFNVQPNPFAFDLKARSESRVLILKEELKAASK